MIETYVFEEHHEVLAHWWSRGLKKRTLICFDAHLDVQFISPHRIEPLLQAATLGEFIGRGKPHHLSPQSGYCYSIEDFLYAAFRIGIIGDLIWVAPPHVAITDSTSAISELSQMDGLTLEEIRSFRRIDSLSGEAVCGRLLGLPITICRHSDLADLEIEPFPLVDIDLDYFVSVPGDQPAVAIESVIETLDALPDLDSQRTISRSFYSGFLPETFLPLGERLVEHWSGRKATPTTVTFCPTRVACSVPARMIGVSAEDVLHWAALSHQVDGRVEGLDAPVEVHQAITAAAFGMLWVELEYLSRAIHCYRLAMLEFESHAELALEIAKKLLEKSQSDSALNLLADALEDDKTTAAAHYYAAVAHQQAGRWAAAIEHAERSHCRTPLWLAPMSLLETLYRQNGADKDAGAMRSQRETTEDTIKETMRRLAR